MVYIHIIELTETVDFDNEYGGGLYFLDAVGGLAREESLVVHLQLVDPQPRPESVLVPGLEPLDRQSGLGLFLAVSCVATHTIGGTTDRHLVHVPLDPQRGRFTGHLAVELHRLARVSGDIVQLSDEVHDAFLGRTKIIEK